MPNEQLLVYIKSEISDNVSRNDISLALISNGWKIEDVNNAFSTIDTPQPVVPIASSVNNNSVQPAHSNVPNQQAYMPSSQKSNIKLIVQNAAVYTFIACVLILTTVSIFGVWKILSGDVIFKSFETLGILAIVAVIVIVSSRFVGDPTTKAESEIPNPVFRAIRNITLGVLIVSATLLAFLGVLSIWDVITNTDILSKSMNSLIIITFSSIIIVTMVLDREHIGSRNIKTPRKR